MEKAMAWMTGVIICTALAGCLCIGCKDSDGNTASTKEAEKTAMITLHMDESQADVLQQLVDKPCAVVTTGNEMTAYWPGGDSTTCTSTSWGTKLTFTYGKLSGFENLWSNVEVDLTPE